LLALLLILNALSDDPSEREIEKTVSAQIPNPQARDHVVDLFKDETARTNLRAYFETLAG
jgi:hypothetical protein